MLRKCQEQFLKEVKEFHHIGHRKANLANTQKCRNLFLVWGIAKGPSETLNSYYLYFSRAVSLSLNSSLLLDSEFLPLCFTSLLETKDYQSLTSSPWDVFCLLLPSSFSFFPSFLSQYFSLLLLLLHLPQVGKGRAL